MNNLLKFILLLILYRYIHCKEEYSEEYFITSLPNNDLAHIFRFKTLAINDDNKPFKLYPLTIYQLFKHKIDEIHLSMTSGYWRHDKWGLQSQIESPTGFLLNVKFNDDLNETEISKTWSLIVKQVNGFFCSSILEIDPYLTVIPTYINNSIKYRSAHLSGEPLCTENVKPFLRLLPCKNSGLGKLIFSKEIHNYPYHSLGIHAIRKDNKFKLELNAVNVNSRQNLLRNNGQFAQITQLGNNLKCKVANEQKIYTILNSGYKVVEPENSSSIIDIQDDQITGKDNIFSIKMNRNLIKEKLNYKSLFQIMIAQEQSDFRGGIMTTTIINNYDEDVIAFYFHSIPWQFRITVNLLEYKCTLNNGNIINGIILKKQMNPSIIQKKALTLQYDLKLPKNSRCTLKLPFSNNLMTDMSYPPDSNYGIFVPSPLLVVNITEELFKKYSNIHGNFDDFEFKARKSQKSEGKHEIKIYGEPLLILLPVPDFSMPFNVFMIATTVAGFFFGSFFNINTKLYIPKMK